MHSYNQNEQKPNGKYRRARATIRIGQQVHKFVQHRPMNGVIKTLTIKRDNLNRLWLCFSVEEIIAIPIRASTDHYGGFDFGLRVFLTDEQGRTWLAEEFFKNELDRIRALNKAVSRKQDGSHNQQAAQWLLSREHIRIADKRRDFHYKLANELCQEYDVLCFEDLNIEGMKRLWGRKVSDLGFSAFMDIIEWVAFKTGKNIVIIGRFERTTQRCSSCKHNQTMELKDRVFCCEKCGLILGRDHNAAINILHAGASAYTGVGVIRPASAGSPA